VRHPPAIGVGPVLQVEVTAAVVLGVRLLALPRADFEQEIRAAADRNPALLARERPCCVRCGRRCAGGTCGRCRRAAPGPALPAPDEAASVVSGWEQLRRDLLAALPSRLAGAAVAVLAAIDERGLLRRQEVAGLPADVLGAVVAALRQVGPPGIGASTAAESLLFQLDAAPLDPAERALARLVLTEHAAALAEGGPAAAARAAGCPPARMTDLLARLSRLLRPFPGLGRPEPAAGEPPGQPPDLIFERNGDGVRALVPEYERWEIEVDPGYRQALAAARPGSSPDQLAVARAQLRAARALVGQVRHRWALLTRLGALLAEVHGDRLLAGSMAFTPLTQAAAADRLGVHASTVSRAVRHRAAWLVDGRVVPLRRLFGAHHDVRAAVADILRAELLRGAPRPSDEAVARALAGQGYRVARRTVAKYRNALP
jgi:RNA polymerase sigma-54 factor